MIMNLDESALGIWMRKHRESSKLNLSGSGCQAVTVEKLMSSLPVDLNHILKEIYLGDNIAQGGFSIRKVIAKGWGDSNPDKVMIFNGASDALFHVINSLLAPEDIVIATDPIYPPIASLIRSRQCILKPWPLDKNSASPINLETLDKIIDSSVKAVVVNFPHNPTGISISPHQMDELIGIVKRYNCFLILDAVFEDIDPTSHLSMSCLKYDRSVSINSLSKAFGMPGLRIGWILGGKEIIDRCIQLRDYTTHYVSPVNERIAEAVISNKDKLLPQRSKSVQDNIKIVNDWLEINNEYVGAPFPQGGAFMMLKVRNVQSTYDFCENLLDETGVMLVPGECFGLNGFVRLSLGTDRNTLVEGLSLLTKFFKKTETSSPQKN